MTEQEEANHLLSIAREFLSQQEIAEGMGTSAKTVGRWETGGVPTPRRMIPALRQLLETNGSAKPVGKDFSFIDLFAGIGGIRLGFESAGGNCVYTSEWDRYSQKTYRLNFGSSHPIVGDITTIPEGDIPKHDVLLAGFPCQPFSIAGVSKKNALGRPHGFECKTQGTLFFDVARIIKRHKPIAFLLENVKNLQSHDRGNTFRIIMETLRDELGYKQVESRIINAKGFVPQNRERIFIVGFRERTGFRWDDLILPDPASCSMKNVLHPEDGTEESEPESRFIKGKKGRVLPKYTLSNHLWEYLQDYAAKHQAQGNGFGYGLVGKNDIARTLSARYYKDGSEILVSRGKGNPRRLTPRECARLMGFDPPESIENPAIRFKIPVSDTQAYKQFGNSVAVPVVREVARIMQPHIMELKRKEQVLEEMENEAQIAMFV